MLTVMIALLKLRLDSGFIHGQKYGFYAEEAKHVEVEAMLQVEEDGTESVI